MRIDKEKMRKNFERNLKLFKKLNEQAYEIIKKYKPVRFRIAYKDGKVDILDMKTLTLLYDFKLDEFCEFQVQNFLEFATLIMFNLNFSERLERFGNLLHIKFLKRLEDIFRGFDSYQKENFRVPVGFTPTLIVAGMGPGVVLEKLIDRFFVRKLYIFEPSSDFFYISLFLIDWEKIYSKFKSPNDVILQVGKPPNGNLDFVIETQMELMFDRNPLLGAYTFVFRHYKNEETFKAVVKARSAFNLSLRGWGFYEDEKEGFEQSVRNLSSNSSKIIYIKKEYAPPKRVFIVGSGPSLDESLDYIRRYAESAVIFACGTAINPLVENGIIPDFLIELERTYHINEVLDTVDPEVLKKMYLIAPDVIHPEVPPRFKDTLYFIRDEGVTSFLLRPKTKVVGVFPTVTNTALALALKMGVEEIYLFGVDLGFKEEGKAHAKGTVYNKKGTPFYRADRFQKEFLLEGNFGGSVYTTGTFNWARKVMEEVIFSYAGKSKVYNCSDGVRIAGTIPLKPSALNLSVLSKEEEVKKVVSAFVEDYKEALRAEPFEKILEGIEFFRRVVPESLNRKVASHEELVYLLEDVESILKVASETIGMNVFVRGTLRHMFHTLYIYMLRLKDFSEIEPAYLKAKEVMLEFIKEMMDDLEDFVRRYERDYRKLAGVS